MFILVLAHSGNPRRGLKTVSSSNSSYDIAVSVGIRIIRNH